MVLATRTALAMPCAPDEEQVIDRILAHADGDSTDKVAECHRQSVDSYIDPTRFQAEMALLRAMPIPIGSSATWREPGAYLARRALGWPILVARGQDGVLRGFLNACRHRGAELVAAGAGCKKAFVCNYHGWTYANSGELIHIPHEELLDPGHAHKHPLTSIALEECGGLVWWVPASAPSAVELFAPIAANLEFLRLGELEVVRTVEREMEMNWKIYAETFLEGYHIRSLHRDSFYPYGYDTLTLNDYYGPHARVIFPFRRIESLRDRPRPERRLRRLATLVHHLFPTTMIGVVSYHVMVNMIEPIDPRRTRMRVMALARREEQPSDKLEADIDTLFAGIDEDVAIGESIQRTLASGANRHLTFSRAEGALAHFHQALNQRIAAASGAR
jgi:phenylpropionate dioxygenase-like ring-hydroxylating dioxygenase large terminal subunit